MSGWLGPIRDAGLPTCLAFTLLLYVLFCAAQRFLSRVSVFRFVAIPLNLLVLCGATLLFLSDFVARLHPWLVRGLNVAAFFLLAHILLRMLDLLLFELIPQWRRRKPVPVVLRDIGRWAVDALILVFLIRTFFPEVNLNVLAVSSIIVGYIVGNATQDTLGNLVAGLALNSERPFYIGDWITTGSYTGVVVDVTWRATRLRTTTEDYIVIPNSSISREPIINYSRPTTTHGCVLQVGVSYDAPPNRVRRVILDAIADVPGTLRTPPPKIWLLQFADFSVNYQVKFFIDDFARRDELQSSVMDQLWYRLKRAGIAIPYPIRDVFMHAPPEGAAKRSQEATADRIAELSRIDIFRLLPPDDLAYLADQLAARIYAAGELLVRQGDEPGGTFHIIREGEVTVASVDAGGRETFLARLGPGAFFGEMSLLTGEPRSANVRATVDVTVLELSKSAFAAVLGRNPQLAEELGRVLAQRHRDRTDKMAANQTGGQEADAALRRSLISRIRSFFGLGETTAG